MIYSFRDIERVGLKLVILCHFLPFYSPKNLKNQDFEKWKKLLEISSFCTCVPKTTIIWGMVPEIRSETGLFCHIGQFFALFPPKNTENQNFEDWKKHLEISSFYTCVPQMKIIWCAVPDIWSTTHIIFCHFGPVFSLLRP